ncbi:transporter substrate-binding domain-containing protein [Phyllobacterium sp. UNC302MFCol5.2]|uniref:transporter substrate-binding domain-containing protein n=1 Tax=Phyllobacterium sp. UNC302MFCol5.2 TaxID=1449065 RepID=UPI001FD98EB9|nr:transporter substrate-binding domain-containing protein [Phyllobacterium sp. UNC302MFCol5.2]
MRRFALTIALMTLVAPAFAGETLDRVMGSKILTMSSDAEYPPQSFLNDKNEMDGFDIDVGKEIARRLGVALKIVTPGWDVITAGGWAGRWDVSIGSMAATPERAKVLNFPAIYYFTPASFAVHKDSNITTIGELNDRVIGVCTGCSYESYLQKNLKLDAPGVPPFTYQVTAKEIKSYETDTNAYDDLRLGQGVRLEAVLSALPTLREAIKKGYPMKVIGDPVFYEPLAVATDKGDPEFDAKITEAVDAMRKDGTLKALSEKWYGVDLTSVK